MAQNISEWQFHNRNQNSRVPILQPKQDWWVVRLNIKSDNVKQIMEVLQCKYIFGLFIIILQYN
jgi:hypothetical protein